MVGDEKVNSGDYKAIRMKKVEQLKKLGMIPFAERFDRTHYLADAQKLPDGSSDVSLAGRVVGMRRMGNLTFATLHDYTGRVQVAFNKKELGDDIYKMLVTKIIDVGDFIGCSGEMFTTKTKEKTLRVKQTTFLSKAFRPLPEKYHGINDVELCYRQRYLDLIMNEETLSRFKIRTKIVKEIRTFLEQHKFVEVETPALCNMASGAMARPFSTHHNALDIDVYLRIAPETYLKRLIAGGYDRIYEFARCFRNEGISATHLQDFTMLECYAAYWNFADNMKFTKQLIQTVLDSVFGSQVVVVNGDKIDFSGEWPTVSFVDLIKKDCGIDLHEYENANDLRKVIIKNNILLNVNNFESMTYGNLVDNLYKKVSRPKMVCPIFLTEHPIETSPLSRRNDINQKIADRYQLVVNGVEVINAYSELIDPIEQEARLREQLVSKGRDETMPLDFDFIKCMEYGMPPMSGWGLGIDRFCQLLCSCENIRDVVWFPLMRPVFVSGQQD